MKQYLILLSIAFILGCSQNQQQSEETNNTSEEPQGPTQLVVEAEQMTGSSADYTAQDGMVLMDTAGWFAFNAALPVAGRYRVEVVGTSEQNVNVWLEDYVGNKDGRTYNVTGTIGIGVGETPYVEGSPFNSLTHKMRLHLMEGTAAIDKVVFTLMKEHQVTPKTLTQSMEGDEWVLAWSDEFDGQALDTSKWLYDIGNWGWGNNELQYYTENRTENARVEEGNLIIEARKGDMGQEWTSARLTTRGKVSFLYGKIELRARVPAERGNWAAGWMLGDSYVDELSWPYSGEIDILESVGYEIDDENGDGIAHVTMHTPAYYFKIGNQISGQKDVYNMVDEFHTYAVEWDLDEIRGYVDGEQYYVYDKNANEMEWPFDQPQNLILNLAMGGGWGGAQGMDPEVTSQKYILDYVRVYELK